MAAPGYGYAIANDGAYIAYQILGDGPIDVAYLHDYFGDLDLLQQFSEYRELWARLSVNCRLILHDRRATGLSSRNFPAPSLETRVSDLRAVLDAVDSERVVLAGHLEGGAPGILFAASMPERVRSLIWHGPSARSTWTPDYPFGVGPEYVERERRSLEAWGTPEFGQAFFDTEAAEGAEFDPAEGEFFSRLSRHTTTPDVARELSRVWYETDIRDLLPTVRVPALLVTLEDDHQTDREEARYMASLMPDAEAVVMPGKFGDVDGVVDAILGFLGVDEVPHLDRVLTSVLFTDIVDSTVMLTDVGDTRWAQLLAKHDEIIHTKVEHFHGRYIVSTGDGVLATFDGPARAVRCGTAIGEAVSSLGLRVRAGCHTGEVEITGENVRGVTVHVGARIAALAGPSEVLVSSTVRDLTAGSGLTFEDAGEHELKGVPDRWRLYRVVA